MITLNFKPKGEGWDKRKSEMYAHECWKNVEQVKMWVDKFEKYVSVLITDT